MKITDVYSMRHEADLWKPQLQIVDDIDVCADYINIPHKDDYPQFVNSTKETIKHGIENFTKDDIIAEREIKQIHRLIFKEKDYIKIGDWRHTNVHINNEDGSVFEPPEAYLVPQLMISICPIEIGSMSKEDIILWYKRFETIHPFQDGNGRVGGVIMAIVSYINFGEFITTKIFEDGDSTEK
jgi:fido (protein-threonine AMPylation protein)